MRLAEEVVAAHFAPTWRSLLVRELDARGLSQVDIAALLGVSQSAVSKHLLGKLVADARLAREPRMQEAAARVARGLAEKSLSPFEALHEAESLVRSFEDRGPICAIHEEEMPSLQGLGCDLCVRVGESPLLAEQAALQDLRAALRILENEPGIARLVPHVGANLARAVPGARDVSQVAAVPGRLFEMRGRVQVPAPPEFGVSRHTAEVLLAVMRADASKLAVMNLAPAPELLERSRTLGLRVARVAPGVESNPASLSFVGVVPDVFHHEGDFGVEPQAYVAGVSAVAVALLVKSLTSLISR